MCKDKLKVSGSGQRGKGLEQRGEHCDRSNIQILFIRREGEGLYLKVLEVFRITFVELFYETFKHFPLEVYMRKFIYILTEFITETIELTNELSEHLKLEAILFYCISVIATPFLILRVVVVIGYRVGKNISAVIFVIKNKVSTASSVETYNVTGMLPLPIFDHPVESIILSMMKKIKCGPAITRESEFVDLYVVCDRVDVVPRVHSCVTEMVLEKVKHLLVVCNIDISFIEHGLLLIYLKSF
jgi:hypothetical protein